MKAFGLPTLVKGALAGALIVGLVVGALHFAHHTPRPSPAKSTPRTSTPPFKRTQAANTRPKPSARNVATLSSLQGTKWIQDTPAGCQLPFYQLKMNPQDLTDLERNPRSNDRRSASFTADGVIYDQIGVRDRGDWARTWPKKSLKIFFDKDKPFDRQHVLNLNSAWRDPAFLREPLAYHVYEACGALSLKARMVRLHLNGQFWGLYVQVEQPDKSFLSRYNMQGASIYKAISKSRQSDERNLGRPEAYATHYEKENRKTEGFDELHQFCRELEQTSNVVDFFVRRVDVDKYINYLAATVLVQNWDSPNKNHFLVFDARGSQKWLVVPWDLDRTFGDHWHQYFTETRLPILLGTRQVPSTTGWNRMAERFLAEPTLRARFLDRLAELLDQEFTSEKLYPLLDRWEAEVAQEATLDRQRWGGGQSEELHSGIAQVKLYIKQRRAYLLNELTKLR